MDVRDLNIRQEIENLRYEPAVDLGDVVKGIAPQFVQDPVAFFERTHFTESMKKLIIKTFMNLLGLRSVDVGNRRYEVSSNLILLPSDLGGGKTHSLILLYHIFKLINESNDPNDVVAKIEILDKDLANFVLENWGRIKEISPKVVVIDCKYSDFAPSPVKPIEIGGRKVKTLWGYLGYELGKYELIKDADEREVAPYADVVFRILNESRAVILIDEIGRYYDQSGLEPTKISVFLMNLAEAMSKYTIREVSVVISLPYELAGKEVEARPSMRYVHSPELINAINKVLSRPNVEIIKPVERRDLVEILRKRIFAHSKEELEKFADDFIASELSREYPARVRKVLEDKIFWREVRKTYPFHPMFLDTLEKLTYKLPYLQRTRDAIKIAVQTVLAIKNGLFDWLEDKVGLIMPYHIPVFIGEVLDETVLRNAPSEYKVFQLILRGNVAEPASFDNLKKMKKEEFYEKVIARSLRDLKEEDAELGFKLASIIWLYSLVGLGLPMNMGDFPTTADLIYSVSPTEFDAKGVLGILRSILPQLIVHGDPESDTARWFFTSIPSVEELIEILKRNVTDEMAKDKLAEFLEEGLIGKRGRGRSSRRHRTLSIFNENVAVVRVARSVSKEVLESNDPALVVFADTVPKDEFINLLKGRNNIVAIAPYVEGFDHAEELSSEDIKGIRELAGFRNRSVWEGLLEILRYYVATESITEDHLKSFVGEKVTGGGEEYKLLIKDIMKLLKGKIDNKKDYFYRHAWNLINRCYRRVYYYRIGKLQYENGLALESDKPIASIVEEFLSDRGLIPSKFERDDLLSIVKDYLGKDPKRDPINVGHLWNFIRTTDKANVPIVSYKMFIDAVKDLIKTLDYAVKIKEKMLWKPIFNSKSDAERKDEGEMLLKKVEEFLTRIGASWNDIELVYWENIFDEWIKEIISNVPEDKLLKILDRRGNVLDVRDVLAGFDPKSAIKAGKLFYEKRKYIVELKSSLPKEIWEKKEYTGSIMISIKNFDEEVEIRLYPDRGLEVEPKTFKGKAPLTCQLRLKADRAGDYKVIIEILGKGELLERRVLSVPVKGEWKEVEITLGKDIEHVREGIKVVYVETTDLLGVQDVIRLAKIYGGKIVGKVVLQTSDNSVRLNLGVKDSIILEMLWSPINNLMRILKGRKTDIYVRLSFEKEIELKDVVQRLSNPERLKFKVKERIVGVDKYVGG